MKEHLTRERTRRNRDLTLLIKSHDATFGAPAYDTQRPSPRGGRVRSMSPGSSRSRASSLKKSRSLKRAPSPKTQLCHDFQKGKRTRGDKWKYPHKTKSRSPGRSPGRAPMVSVHPASFNLCCAEHEPIAHRQPCEFFHAKQVLAPRGTFPSRIACTIILDKAGGNSTPAPSLC